MSISIVCSAVSSDLTCTRAVVTLAWSSWANRRGPTSAAISAMIASTMRISSRL